MPSFGITPAGFVVKPTSAILSDMQQAVWASPQFSPDLDLSPQTPDGQMLAVVANAAGSIWELLQVAFNQMNREDAEGAALDNLGDIIGVPREGETYTQVYCTCALSSADAPYAAGSLVANVNGQPAQTFSNVASVQASDITSGSATVLFQATAIGPTPAPAPGTITQITSPVTGWTSVTNPLQGADNALGYTSLGQAEEADAAYGPRQASEVAVDGSCNPSATVAAIEQLGASQQPPVTLTASIVVNTTQAAIVSGGVTIQPTQYAIFVYDPTGWLGLSAANLAALGQIIWNNRPAGNLDVGTTQIQVQDATLGQQTVTYTPVVPEPLYVSATIAVLPGQVFANVAAAVQTALITAAVAPTPASGIPPAGQLAPGAPVIGSQLSAVISGVPGVADVKALTFGFSSSPSNTTPITVPANEVATITQANIANIVITQGSYP